MTVEALNNAFQALLDKAKALPSHAWIDLNDHIKDAILQEQSWKHRRPDTYAAIVGAVGVFVGFMVAVILGA